jgi:L-malate glycosyltransferase
MLLPSLEDESRNPAWRSMMASLFNESVLGVAGPVDVPTLLGRARDGDLPNGMGGSPVNTLCEELLNRGHRVVVFTLDPEVRAERTFEQGPIKVCVGPYRARRAWDAFSQERAYLAQAIRRENPALVHAQWTYEYALGAAQAGLPYVVTAHDAPIRVLQHTGYSPYRMVRTAMAYWALRRSETVAAVSPYVASHLRRYGFCRGDLAVIPNGLPEAAFQPRLPTRPPGEGWMFATVLNGWGGFKNGAAAVRAFARVRQTLPTSKLLMFGVQHGPGDVAERWARARNLDLNVQFIGALPRERLLQTLRDHVDVLVHPSLEESHGMALIECMAMGIPVIGGRDSGAVPIRYSSPRQCWRPSLTMAGASKWWRRRADP